MLLALTAGAAWAAYILLSARTGRRFPRLDGLTIAMAVAAVLVTPFGVATAGVALVSAEALLLERLRAAGFNAQMTPLEDGVRRTVQDFLMQEDPFR